MIAAEHAETDRVADANRADVSDSDGRALLSGDHDVLHVLCGLDQPDATHGHAILASLHEAAAGVGVVVRDCVEHLLQAEVVGAKLGRIDVDLILFDAAAPRDDIGDAGYLPELALEHPVL